MFSAILREFMDVRFRLQMQSANWNIKKIQYYNWCNDFDAEKLESEELRVLMTKEKKSTEQTK